MDSKIRDTANGDALYLAPADSSLGFGEEAFYKFNNIVDRWTRQADEIKDYRVEYVARTRQCTLYAYAFRPYCDRKRLICDALYHKGNQWYTVKDKREYTPRYVSAFIASIYGFASPSDSQIATALMAYKPRCFITRPYAPYVVVNFPGGVGLVRLYPGDKLAHIDFKPYETLDPHRVGDFYAAFLSIVREGCENLPQCEDPVDYWAELFGLRKKEGETEEYELAEE